MKGSQMKTLSLQKCSLQKQWKASKIFIEKYLPTENAWHQIESFQFLNL